MYVSCFKLPLIVVGSLLMQAACGASRSPSSASGEAVEQPMCPSGSTRFVGSVLGGANSCVPVCTTQPSGPESACTESNQLLLACSPKSPAGCPLGEFCLRTSLLSDAGVCVAVPTCNQSSDCRNPQFPACLTALLLSVVGNGESLTFTSLTCAAVGCKSLNRACPQGTTCLSNIFTANSSLVDACVPVCDERNNCPPNYSCLRKASGPTSPNVCIPGIVGIKCTSKLNCLIGDCVPVDASFSVCAPACAADSDCALFDTDRGVTVCGLAEKGQRVCLLPSTFAGAPCITDDQCAKDRFCHQYSHYGDDAILGECRLRCNNDSECPSVSGIAAVCLNGKGAGGCHPGRFSVPCTDSDHCVGDLKCLQAQVLGVDDKTTNQSICSAPCTSDMDCQKNRWTDGQGFCDQNVCVLERNSGRLCTSDRQCRKRPCSVSARPGEASRGLFRCE